MMSWRKRWSRRLRALLRQDAVEREMADEMAFHLEMAIEQNLRAGMPPAEARRQARLAFGAEERFREEVRDARAWGWLSGLRLDLKLGLRMLRRYPGITLVGGLAMAFALGGGAATFEVVTQLLHPRLPLDDGARVVGVQNWDAGRSRVHWRMAADLEAWRGQLRTVEELGAFRTVQRNLIVEGGSAEPVSGVEMTASGFRVARVPPLLGRYLVEADQVPGAAPVVVLDHALWQRRFRGNPRVVGTRVRLGSAVHTVVGVMPRGFGFPLGQRIWLPLRLRAEDRRPGEGPELRVFGRLSPGASLADARAELALLGRRAAASWPETHRRLQPRVQPYARSIMDLSWGAITGAAYGTNAGVLAFLLLVCANVATLVFARTASRETELVVRTALGASRRRIVLQLFAEALVLGTAAAVVGLAAATLGLRWAMGTFEAVTGELPFWFSPRLSLRTIGYTLLLAGVGAVVAGVVPALKMTGRGAEQRLRQAAMGGSSLRFGRLWTGIIVTQVALTAAFLPLVFEASLDAGRIRAADVGFPAREYLSARLRAETPDPGADSAAWQAQFANRYAELEQRLRAEPGVIGVTHAAQLPGAYHVRRPLEVEGGMAPPVGTTEHRIQTGRIAPGFFEALGAPVLVGRGLRSADLGEGARTVVVNESFVRHVLGGRPAVGRRLRYLDHGDDESASSAGPWHEIVGVVRDVALTVAPDLPHNAGIYHAAGPDAGEALAVLVHLRGEPEHFAPRLRAVATAVDPTLRVHGVRSAADSTLDALTTYRFWVRVAYAGCGVVLLLAILGMHAIMSFTVARRTREIGIRVALGAHRWQVMRSIFVRTFTQVATGTALGVLLVVVLAGGIRSLRIAGVLAAGVALMVLATAVAGFVPTRRALRVPPMEAMRTEG